MKDWVRYGRSSAMSEASRPRRESEIQRPGYTEYIHYGIKDDNFNDRPVVDAALKKLDEIPDDAPFFLFVGVAGPHSPYIVGQEFLDLYDINDIRLPESFTDIMQDKPAMYRRMRGRFDQLTPEEHCECLRHYYAYCTFEDYLFGLLLDKLENRGLLNNTVVVYNSDHGDYASAHGLWEKGLPCFKEAYHINSVIGYGGVRVRRRMSDALISLADYTPTFLELAGIVPERRFAGRSMAGFLRGEEPDSWRTELYTQTNGNENYGIQRSVFNKRYKYVYNPFDFDELYDLANDPHEIHNIIGDPAHACVVKEMCEKMWRFAYENQDDISNDYMLTALAPYGPGIIFE